MSMVGTFDGFTAARLGLYAAQHGLRVTGNNVANINTVGYTRQRVDQVSFKTGANDVYRSFYDNHVGSGALVTSISQLRDPYLDIRYRNASTDTYHYDTWLAGLQKIASILDEVGKGDNEDGLIYKAIQDLAEKLRAYSADPTTLNDRLVRNSAESLTLLFHNAADRLEKLYNETANEFGEDVDAVNEILINIRDLNKSIREAEIHGDAALEMRDERNRQIDALSQYLDIKVQYSIEDVGAGVQVEKLTIRLNNANPDPKVTTDESVLVDGTYATQLSIPKEKPALNLFDKETEPEYAYLNQYLYRRELTEESPEIKKLLDAWPVGEGENPPTPEDLGLVQARDEYGVPKFDEKTGLPLYLVGTNDGDVDGVVKEENNNFTLQLGKLTNEKGAAWKSSSTRWLDVDRATVIANATFTYTIGTELDEEGRFVIVDTGTDEDGNQIEIKHTYKVVPDGYIPTDDDDFIPVELSTAQDPAAFAEFLADKFKDLNKYKGYKIEAVDDQIHFTADPDGEKDPETGEPLYYPPANLPLLSVVYDGEGPSPISVSKIQTIPTITYDEHGNEDKSVNYVQDDTGRWYQITVETKYTHEVTLDDNDLRGILQAERELLTEEGEFSSTMDVAIDESALTKRGIPYYIKSLDLLAQKFAEAYNQLNSGYAYNQDGNYIREDGTELTINEYVYDEYGKLVLDDYGNPAVAPKPVSADGLTRGQLQYLIENDADYKEYILQDDEGFLLDKSGNYVKGENNERIHIDSIWPGTAADVLDKIAGNTDKWLEKNNGWKMGGELFASLNGESIKAGNITISGGWSNGDYGLIPTFMMLFTDSGGLAHSTKNDNADHMVAMIDKALSYNPRDLDGSDAIGPELFNGSFNDMLSNMMSVEGEDASITNVRLTTSAGILNEMDYAREGVSGVDLNDEAMNMITYQKAMSAAMRVMTVIDEMLDRLINNTAI